MEVILQVATKNGYVCGKSASDKKSSSKKLFNTSLNSAESTKQYSQEDSVDLSFENVSVSVPLGFRKGRKEILHKINGNFRSGQLIAIIGPSGAGKTTLLEALSGYRTSGVTGIIKINELNTNLNILKKHSYYITHENHLQPLLTVWENMKIAADLKLGPRISQEKQDIIINEILSMLSLDKCACCRTGHLSGGQRKMLSIALELIDDPLLMFLDEPTTGLDSYSSSQCIKVLKRLAKQGKTVICTIHQPLSIAFQQFDQIYVLAEGNCLYQGAAENLVHFLDSVNLPCPKYHNPADFVIELACGEYGKDKITKMVEAAENGKNHQWLNETKSSKLKMLEDIQENSIEKVVPRPKLRKTSQYGQFKILLRRGLLKAKRDVTLTYLRLIVNLLSGLLYGALYWQSGTDAAKVRYNYGLLFCVLVHHLMCSTLLTILTFPSEMPILSKEYFNRWYSLKMYLLSLTVADIPVLAISCLSFTSIVYLMSGQPLEINRAFMFSTVCLLVVLVAHSFGYLIGSCFNVKNGVFVAFAVSSAMTMLAGFGEQLKYNYTFNLHWLSYGSYLKYGFEGIIASIYGYNRGPIECPGYQYCHYTNPKKFLRDIEVRAEQFWIDILGLCLFFACLRILAFVVLKLKLTIIR